MFEILTMIAALQQDPAEDFHRGAQEFSLSVVRPSLAKRSMSWTPEPRVCPYKAEVDDKLRDRVAHDLGALIEPRYGSIRLGPDYLEPFPFVVSKIDAARAHHERLIIDANRDGRFDPKREVFDARAKLIDERTIVRHDPVMITIPYSDTPLAHEYRIEIHYPKDDEVEQVDVARFDSIRVTRRSWLEGVLEIEGRRYRVAFIDDNNDGAVTKRDRWIIVEENDETEDVILKHRELTQYMRSPLFIEDDGFGLRNVTESGLGAQMQFGHTHDG